MNVTPSAAESRFIARVTNRKDSDEEVAEDASTLL